MNLEGKSVLLTGAAGFIGSHLAEILVRKGCKLRALVRYNSRNDRGLLSELLPDIQEEIEIVHGDLRDADCIRHAVQGTQVVFHLGALIAIPYSYVNPRDVVDTNVTGTLNVLMAARDHGIERMVHTSTSEVYGTARYVPIDETHPLQGQSPYSASKIGADKIVESFHDSFNLPVSTLRPFNTYGPRQSARAVIPTIITQALVRNQVRLGATTTTRDFTFVEDTARGFISIAEADEAVGGTFNIGSNFEISINDLALKIAGLIGTDIEIIEDRNRLRPEKSEVERLWASADKAASKFGWKNTVTLDEGLRRTIDWPSHNLGRYRPGEYTR
ncbi:MAG: NAD-dependent epimerase/dehydratase [Stygiobacter sp.]|nr:MAG: NAD-dependent epimerase/dehydratase [Stygiobacter sp.]